MKIFINSLFIICQRFLLLQKRKLWISLFVKEKRENKKWKEEKEKEREFL